MYIVFSLCVSVLIMFNITTHLALCLSMGSDLPCIGLVDVLCFAGALFLITRLYLALTTTCTRIIPCRVLLNSIDWMRGSGAQLS
jgi:hypothetical protein